MEHGPAMIWKLPSPILTPATSTTVSARASSGSRIYTAPAHAALLHDAHGAEHFDIHSRRVAHEAQDGVADTQRVVDGQVLVREPGFSARRAAARRCLI
jgi:hypothetical protein